MADIIIYTSNFCPYCVRAKNLLSEKGVSFNEIDVTSNDNLRIEMIDKSGGKKTVPQIFINGIHIGGFDNLSALDKEGELDKLFKND